ncbi:Uncharacterised protein [Vibrio cholerae]|nr:Uncharacterised protein [Vibrio cholerae]CSI21904.1 Uncharacterised protein [Vibrio cholerae]
MTVHDFGEEVALNAVKAFVYWSFRITLCGDNATILGSDQHRTACTTKTARCFVPMNCGLIGASDQVGGRCGEGDPCNRRS